MDPTCSRSAMKNLPAKLDSVFLTHVNRRRVRPIDVRRSDDLIGLTEMLQIKCHVSRHTVWRSDGHLITKPTVTVSLQVLLNRRPIEWRFELAVRPMRGDGRTPRGDFFE